MKEKEELWKEMQRLWAEIYEEEFTGKDFYGVKEGEPIPELSPKMKRFMKLEKEYYGMVGE